MDLIKVVSINTAQDVVAIVLEDPEHWIEETMHSYSASDFDGAVVAMYDGVGGVNDMEDSLDVKIGGVKEVTIAQWVAGRLYCDITVVVLIDGDDGTLWLPCLDQYFDDGII